VFSLRLDGTEIKPSYILLKGTVVSAKVTTTCRGYSQMTANSATQMSGAR
jgi:hypothetical protein